MKKEMNEEKKDGCPCGTFGKCCDKQKIIPLDHECSDEKVCESCYGLECLNCGATCHHEL